MLVATRELSVDSGGLYAVSRRLLAVLLCIVAVFTSTVCSGEVFAQETVDPDADFRGLRETVYRVQSYSRTVTKIRKDLDAGKTSDALVLLQKLLDEPEDSFVLYDELRRAFTLRLQINRLLAKQSREVMREYEETTGRLAESVLNEAIETEDLTLLTSVVRRFLHTKAGFRAVQLSVRHMLDRGDAESAVRLLSRVENSTAHANRVRSEEFHFLKAIALIGSGHTEDARKVLANSNWSPAEQSRLKDSVSVPFPLDDEWLNVFGNASRNKNTSATRPWLRSEWSIRFLDDHPDSRNSESARQMATAFNNLTTVRTPVAANDVVAVRELDRVSGYDLSSGRRLWSFGCNYSLFDAVREPGVSSSLTTQRAVLNDAVTGTISTDGTNVYTVDTVKAANVFDAYTMATVGGQVRINRLVALPLKSDSAESPAPAWIAGGTYSLPEWFSARDSNRNRMVTAAEFGDNTLFTKLDVNRDEILTADEAIASNKDTAPLADHFFLGPPLAIHGRLYCVTESAKELFVVALDAETGAVVWEQRIAYSTRSISGDLQRQRYACTPTYADGILICPTNNNVLVAVDAFDGSLVWGAFHGATTTTPFTRRGAFRYSSSSVKAYGDDAFTTAPVVHGDRVFYRPRYARSIQCFELQSGKRTWVASSQAVRTRVDQCVAAVTDDTVLVLGDAFIRGLRPEDGTQLWLNPLQSLTGRGFRSGSKYMLPVDSGRVLAIDIKSGESIGFSRSHANFLESQLESRPGGLPGGWTPGSLSVVGPWVISSRPDRIDLLPQVGSLLKSTQQRLANQQPKPKDRLLMAELNLAMGQLVPARRELLSLIDNPQADSVLPNAEAMMRELLYLDLSQPADREKEILAELSKYSKRTNDRARYLVHKSRFDLKIRDHQQLMATTFELQQLMVDRPLTINANDRHQVAATAWTNGMIEQMNESADSATRKSLAEDYAKEYAKVRSLDDTNRLVQFARTNGSEQIQQARHQAAGVLTSNADYQRAELLLLRNANSADPTVALTATVALAKLWNRVGLSNGAVLLLNEFEFKFDVTDRMKFALKAARQEIGETQSGRQALAQAEPVPYRVMNASITAVVDNEGLILGEPFESDHSKFPLLSKTFHIFRNPGRTTTDIVAVDPASGAVVGRFACPASHSMPEERVNRGLRSLNCGHYFPVGLYGTVKAVSLLNNNVSVPFWETSLQDLGLKYVNGTSMLAIGPASPSFCSFQTHDSLTVLDPFDGSLRWSRSDVPMRGGLIRNPEMGLFGDDKVIVYLAADNTTYSVYRTSTGEKIRETRLKTAPLQQRRVMGRKLMFVTGSGKEFRYRIWDPVTDEFEFDLAASSRKGLSNKLASGELVALVDEARLVIYDSDQKRFIARLHLPDIEWERVNQIVGHCERDTYYLSLRRSNKFDVSSTLVAFDKKNPITTPMYSDELLAIDRRTGHLKWKRMITKRSFVQTPHFNLPFLISLRYLTDRGTRLVDTLSVELIDKKTGDSLTNQPPLRLDGDFIRVSYDPQKRLVQIKSGHEGRALRGPSGVDIHFGEWLQPDDGDRMVR